MTIELIKQLLDACYLAKRAREMLPALPEGVTSSYIQCLDVIQKLQTRGIWPKISDLSDALNLPRPDLSVPHRERASAFPEVQYGLLLATAPVSGRHFRGGCSVHHPNAGKILCYYVRKERFS